MKELERVLNQFSDEIDPEDLAKRLGTSVCHATNLCLKLVEEGKLNLFFKVTCPRCGRSWKFGGIMEIPDEIECECGNEVVPDRENTKMVFSVRSSF